MTDPIGPQGPTLTPGYQTPLEDPLKALMNALRMQGRYISMGNPYVMSSLQRQSQGLVPRFLQQLMASGVPEGDPAVNTQTMFGDFIQGLTQGRTTMPTWGAGQAQATLGGIGDLLRQIDQAMSGADIDVHDPGALTKAAGQGLLSPLQRAIGGLYWGDYPAQKSLYEGAYSSFLGPELGQGLSKVSTAQGGLWDQVLAEAFGAAGSPASFLDMLMGRLRGSPVGVPSGMMPGSMAQNRAPERVGGAGGLANPNAPGSLQATIAAVPQRSGGAGGLANPTPAGEPQSLLARLLELLRYSGPMGVQQKYFPISPLDLLRSGRPRGFPQRDLGR